MDILKPYMFTNNTIKKRETVINNFLSEVKIPNISMNKDMNTEAKVSNKTSNIYTSMYKDKLFWYFYIILKGMDAYNMVGTNVFKTEKDFKINAIELLRNHKVNLKVIKLKLSDIENDLINTKTISIKTLEALCLVYKQSIIYIKNNIYYDFNYGTKYGIIVCGMDNRRTESIELNPKSERVIEIQKTKYLMSPGKSMKAISGYTLDNLQEISRRLKIKLSDDNGKKRTKKSLYEEIQQKIGI